MIETKLSKIKAFAIAGDWKAAIRIAAKFPELGSQRDAIKKAWSAIQHPAFYREIGIDPQAAIEDGIKALKERYSL